ncbi:MAG: hypothetical protein GKC10_03810 [Methanosarcinales archaeon]|nr:hypothetical protein [Methanosarcinales archaeon]
MICISIILSAGLAAALNQSEMGPDNWLDVNFGMSTDMSSFTDLPWFDSSMTFNFSGFDASWSYFSEYYFSSSSSTVIGGLISQPVSYDIHTAEPQWILLGSGMRIPYSQYQRNVIPGANQLWIRGSANTLAQFGPCPQGTWLQLLAYLPQGGMVEVYEVTPDDKVNRKQYQFFAGYNAMTFQADQPGKNVIFFMAGNQASNPVVVDVYSDMPPVAMTPDDIASSTSGTTFPPASGSQAASGSATSASTTSTSSFTSVQMTSQPPFSSPSPSQGDTTVIIKSEMMGYDVFVDNVWVGKEGTGSDPMDGTYSLKVVGNMDHFIKIFDGEFFYGKPKYYPRGVTTTLNVPRGYAVYV